MDRDQREAALDAIRRELEKQNEDLAKAIALAEKLTRKGVVIPRSAFDTVKRLVEPPTPQELAAHPEKRPN